MKPRTPASKLIPREQIAEFADGSRRSGQKIVTTNGCFDLLHLGHIQYLGEARELGDLLIVGINSDRSVKKLKGSGRPLCNEKTRALQVAGLEAVDAVVIFDEETPEALLGLIRPAIHVKGGDYLPEKLPEKKVVESHGGKVVCVSLLPGLSTTNLIEKINKT